jgi:hypothetical protein
VSGFEFRENQRSESGISFGALLNFCPFLLHLYSDLGVVCNKKSAQNVLKRFCDFRENRRRRGRAFEITFPLTTWNLLTCRLGYRSV